MNQTSIEHKGKTVVSNEFRGIWLYRLEETQSFVVPEAAGFPFEAPWLRIEGGTGRLSIPACYAWDGCTPKFRVFDLGYVGTPDGVVDKVIGRPKTAFASLVHDALYQYYGSHGIPRKIIDRIFYRLLKEARFSCAGIYYFAVRAVGWIFFIGAGIKAVDGGEYSRQALKTKKP
ncbi:MAG: hypothetical protein WCT14_07005 [Treponemataceae bacterium]